jgi:hypothetical protein
MPEHTPALMTVEVTVTDRDHQPRFGLGGPPEQARAMASALAERLNLTPAPAGRLLEIAMPSTELRPILDWLREYYPKIGCKSADHKPLPLAAAATPWRLFGLAVAEDVPFDETVRSDVAAMVDILYSQSAQWFLPEQPIGAVLADRDPVLHVMVEPTESMVYVDLLPPDTELPEPQPSPYAGHTHH